MSIPTEQIQRAITMARVRETQGYFGRVKAGDQRAASLFARLVAGDLNPSGKTSDFGWLSKMPGESQVDGYAEDAICWTADPANRENVMDMVNGAGAPGASIGGGVKERREQNRWVRPVALTAEELAYLTAGGTPIPAPSPQKPYPGDEVFDSLGGALFVDYQAAGQSPNPLMVRWIGRVIWDHVHGDETGKTYTMAESIAEHRREWRSALGLPP